MFQKIFQPLHRLLRWSEQYAKTDMVHFFSANFWLNFSRVISIGTGMLLTIAFANLLTPEQFGTYKYVIAAAGLISTFSLGGLSAAAMRAVAQGKKHVVPAIVRTAIFWSIPASIAALGVSVYYFGHANSELGFAFLIIAITNSFSNGVGATKGILQATGDFRTAVLSGIPRILVPFAIIFLVIFFTKSVVWILLAYFASNTIASWVYYRWTLRRLNIHGSQEDVAGFVRYGKQMTMLGFFQLASGQIDQLLLWHFTTPATLAIYALALAPVGEVQNLLNNFLSVLFPKIAAKSEEEVHKMLPTRLKQMIFVSCTMVLLYIVAVPFLFKYLFPKYLASVLVSQVLALTIIFQSKGVIDVFFTAHGQIAQRSKAILSSQAIEFALFFVLIPLFGLWGAVSATVLSEVIAALAFIFIYSRTRTEHATKILNGK